MKVIFAGGGTGGHLYPAIAIADRLRSNGIEVEFYVSNKGIEARILNRLGYKFKEQNVTAFNGRGLVGKITAIARMKITALRLLPKIKKGDKVLLMGGYVSAPSAIVAKLKGAELYLHEQNSVMGLVNRVFAKLSKKVFLAFEDTANAQGNIIVTGNPVRNEFKNKEKKTTFTGEILILGGSQGSRTINKLVASASTTLIEQGYKITHQTGEGLYHETIEMYGDTLTKHSDKLIIRPYFDNIADVMSKADVTIARSGSGTVYELEAIGCPAIYIPLKIASDNHQYYNALSSAKKGVANLLTEDNASAEELVAKVNEVKKNYDRYKLSVNHITLTDSVSVIVKEMGFE